MGPAPKILKIGQEKFSSPDSSIAAIPRAVEGYPDDLLLDSVFSHTSGHMGVMVLDSDQLKLRL